MIPCKVCNSMISVEINSPCPNCGDPVPINNDSIFKAINDSFLKIYTSLETMPFSYYFRTKKIDRVQKNDLFADIIVIFIALSALFLAPEIIEYLFQANKIVVFKYILSITLFFTFLILLIRFGEGKSIYSSGDINELSKNIQTEITNISEFMIISDKNDYVIINNNEVSKDYAKYSFKDYYSLFKEKFDLINEKNSPTGKINYFLDKFTKLNNLFITFLFIIVMTQIIFESEYISMNYYYIFIPLIIFTISMLSSAVISGYLTFLNKKSINEFIEARDNFFKDVEKLIKSKLINFI